MEHLTGELNGFLKEPSCSLNGRLVVERRGAAVDGCVQLLWRQIGFSLSEPHNQSLSSPIPTTPTHSSPVILSLFDLLQLGTQSLQCCSKPEKRFDPLFIMLLTPVSGYNGIQHIWGGTISVTSNWRPEPGMYCCRHKLSALPSKQMVMMANTLIKSRLSLADCLKHLTASLVMITLVTTLMTGRESML